MIISMADLSVLLTRSRKIVFITGNDHGHVGDSSKDNVHKHGDYGFGGKNKERKRILEFSEAMNMTMLNSTRNSSNHIWCIKNTGWLFFG